MKKIHYYIDFDGVLLDTNDVVAKEVVKYYGGDIQNVFDNLNWLKIFKEAKVINNNLEILKNVQEELNVYILTKIKSLKEGECKTSYLRKNGITCPIILVPIFTSKTKIIVPNKRTVLIDDNFENIKEWFSEGGIAIHFKNTKEIGDLQTNSLAFLEKYI